MKKPLPLPWRERAGVRGKGPFPVPVEAGCAGCLRRGRRHSGTIPAPTAFRVPEGRDVIATPSVLPYNQAPLAEANRLVISLTLHQRREDT